MENESKLFLSERLHITYGAYNQRLRNILIFIESEFGKFPVPILNEIRAAQDHMARCFDERIDGYGTRGFNEAQLQQAKGHFMRALLDGYKYIWYHYGLKIAIKYNIAKFLGDLGSIDNGDFLERYYALHQAAKTHNREARETESIDKDKSIEMYEMAIGELGDMDGMFEKNIKKIYWSIMRGSTKKVIIGIGYIGSAILLINKIWPFLMKLF